MNEIEIILESKIQNIRKRIRFSDDKKEHIEKAIKMISDFYISDMDLFIKNPSRTTYGISERFINKSFPDSKKKLKGNTFIHRLLPSFLLEIEKRLREYEELINFNFSHSIFSNIEQIISQKIIEADANIDGRNRKIDIEEITYFKGWLERMYRYYNRTHKSSDSENVSNPIKPNLHYNLNITNSKKYPDKWYAYYHAIMVALGKKNAFPVTFSKKEIIQHGKEQYNTGEGFYKAWKNIDLNKTYSFVRSLSDRDRTNWKSIITEISDKDADVIEWLNKQPN